MYTRFAAVAVLGILSIFFVRPVQAQSNPIQITPANTHLFLKLPRLGLTCFYAGANIRIPGVRAISETDGQEYFYERTYQQVRGMLDDERREIKRLKRRLRNTNLSVFSAERQAIRARVRRAQKDAKAINNLAAKCPVWTPDGSVSQPRPLPTHTPNAETDEMEVTWANPIDGLGYSNDNPTRYTVVVYVSSSAGNDANNGLTEEEPVRTIAHALTLVRNLSPDQLRLARGDIFPAMPTIALSGFSQPEPLVIRAYGDLTLPRPIVKSGMTIAVPAGSDAVRNLIINDISFINTRRAPGHPDFVGPADTTPGLRLIGATDRVLVENCQFQFFHTGAEVRGSSGTVLARNFVFRRNLVSDNYAVGVPSLGASFEHVKNLVVEGNTFDRNGYNEQVTGAVRSEANIALKVGGQSTGFVSITNNLFTRGSSWGVHIVQGGEENGAIELRGNVFAQMPMAAHLRADAVFASENAVVNASDINPTLNRGWGFEFVNTSALQANLNTFANALSPAQRGDYAMRVRGLTNFAFHTVERNIVRNHPGGLDIHNTLGNPPPQSLAYKDNIFQNTDTETPLIQMRGRKNIFPYNEFFRNRYRNPNAPNGLIAEIDEESTVSSYTVDYDCFFLWTCHCVGTDLRVNPGMKINTTNWYTPWKLHPGSPIHGPITSYLVNDSFTPSNRFYFNECYDNFFSTGSLVTVTSRVTHAKWKQITSETGGAVAQVVFENPDRSPGSYNQYLNLGPATIGGFAESLRRQDKGSYTPQLQGHLTSRYLRGAFNTVP